MKWDNFTADRVRGFECLPGKSQSIFWDGKTPGLGVRVTASGVSSYIFEAKLDGKTIRLTIGNIFTWTVVKAQAVATAYKSQIDRGIDPRQVKADAAAEKHRKAVAAVAAKVRETLTVGDAWEVYLKERKNEWGDRHYADHIAKARAGGKVAKRGTRGRGETIAGPLHPLMAMR